MAGVKGKSGGPRPNSGGYRENSGPDRKPPAFLDTQDPKEFLQAVMEGRIDPTASQVAAAKTLFAHKYPKEELGKKEQKEKKAKETASKFEQAPAPNVRAQFN